MADTVVPVTIATPGTDAIPPVATQPAAVPGAAWYATMDAEHQGHVQARGWDKLAVDAAALQAVQAHRQLQQLQSVPVEQILKLPKDAGDAGWAAVWQRLGAPEKPEGYEFAGIDLGTPEATAAFTAAARKVASDLHVPKAMAEGLTAAVYKQMHDGVEAANAARAAAVAVEQATLDKSWGVNKEANLFVARQAVKNLGVEADVLTALEGQMGFAKVHEFFLDLGKRMGEDRFVTGGPQGANKVLTREQAIAKKGELMANPEFVKAYVAGGQVSDQYKEMLALNTIIVGEGSTQPLAIGQKPPGRY